MSTTPPPLKPKSAVKTVLKFVAAIITIGIVVGFFQSNGTDPSQYSQVSAKVANAANAIRDKVSSPGIKSGTYVGRDGTVVVEYKVVTANHQATGELIVTQYKTAPLGAVYSDVVVDVPMSGTFNNSRFINSTATVTGTYNDDGDFGLNFADGSAINLKYDADGSLDVDANTMAQSIAYASGAQGNKAVVKTLHLDGSNE